jgi:hypothetical protein
MLHATGVRRVGAPGRTVQGLGFGCQGLGFRLQASGFSLQAAGFGVGVGARFRVHGLGFRV